MPKTPSTGWFHQPFLWRAAAADMLIQCSCKACRKTVHYLAADLMEMFPRDAVVGSLWGQCPRCGKAAAWREQERYANSDDVGHTLIRRPAGFRQIQLWKDEWYE